MKITILFTGKTRFGYTQQGIDDYYNRLKYYIKTEIRIIPDLKNSRKMPREEIMKKEGELLIRAIPDNSFIILLDEKGKDYTSLELAGFFEKRTVEGLDICMLIGGAYGFSDQVYNIADQKISLSRLTFSHQMIRMILLEQVYRAFTIIKGEKYHNEG